MAGHEGQSEDDDSEPASKLTDRELLIRVDERSMQIAQGQAALTVRVGALEKAEDSLVAAVIKLQGYVRELRLSKKAARRELEELADTVEEIEDTKVRTLRGALSVANESSRYWTRWAIGLAVVTVLAITGAVITTLVAHVWK